jgi:NAD(P)-dependent dehydrogenase (short-subunit alcohol dehydrogenase family)
VATALIIGASRGIGLAAVKAALQAGYSVRALARSARRIPVDDPKLEKMAGDALDTAMVKRPLTVLLCDDPDAPAGTWHHWAAYDLPPTVRELAVGAAQNKNIKQGGQRFRKTGYGGPCPPHGHGPHHYHFRLLALSIEQLQAGQCVLP